MRYGRHYTLAEAGALRPWVSTLVEIARTALDALGSSRVRSALEGVDAETGGGWPGRAAAQATLDLQRAVAGLQAGAVVVRDIRRGLVDFPAVRDGEEVYLCWLVDEPEITHWHELH